ncbi:hypothetical protein AYI69_g10835 [Smittium culicis]|uniref:Uncharacterized protein n=1 Tax=Smittium culicis TaxID=133412 RepID=A0A1R1X365_9FUNG|nr:hypothetical protein AYI69_g10835 [Smittium culicis]
MINNNSIVIQMRPWARYKHVVMCLDYALLFYGSSTSFFIRCYDYKPQLKIINNSSDIFNPICKIFNSLIFEGTPLIFQADSDHCLLSVSGDFPLLGSGIISVACILIVSPSSSFKRSGNRIADSHNGVTIVIATLSLLTF